MSLFDHYVGPPSIPARLTSLLEQGRMPHALCLEGEDGVGKRLLACAVAQVLTCEQPASGQACGACGSCLRAAQLRHPDVHLLFAQPKDVTVSEVQERLARIAADPYARADFVHQSTKKADGPQRQCIYPVDRVRIEIQQHIARFPVEGRATVVILTHAEYFNAQAANAFLKFLEEPRPKTYFLLTVERADGLLDTIRSRCQHIRIPRLTHEAISEALVVRKVTSASDAAALAVMADGSLTRALELAADQDLHHQRHRILAFLRGVYGLDPSGRRRSPPPSPTLGIPALIDEIKRGRRDQVASFLDGLTQWLRDAYRISLGGDEREVANQDQLDAIRRLVQSSPNAALTHMISVTEEARGFIVSNANTDQVLTRLAQVLGRGLHGEKASLL